MLMKPLSVHPLSPLLLFKGPAALALQSVVLVLAAYAAAFSGALLKTLDWMHQVPPAPLAVVAAVLVVTSFALLSHKLRPRYLLRRQAQAASVAQVTTLLLTSAIGIEGAELSRRALALPWDRLHPLAFVVLAGMVALSLGAVDMIAPLAPFNGPSYSGAATYLRGVLADLAGFEGQLGPGVGPRASAVCDFAPRLRAASAGVTSVAVEDPYFMARFAQHVVDDVNLVSDFLEAASRSGAPEIGIALFARWEQPLRDEMGAPAAKAAFDSLLALFREYDGRL